jgi:hypothetical protein
MAQTRGKQGTIHSFVVDVAGKFAAVPRNGSKTGGWIVASKQAQCSLSLSAIKG